MKVSIVFILILAFSVASIAQNNALNFDGTNEYVENDFDTDLATWTVECWVKADAAPSTTAVERIIDRGYNYAINWGLYDANFRASIEFYNEVIEFISERTYYAASFGTLEANKWYHLTGTYDGLNLKAYTNGVLVTDNEVPHGGAVATLEKLAIGAAVESVAAPFSGQIDEVRIWEGARTQEEIQANMYKELSGSETGLKVCYSFNETAGAATDNKEGTAGYDGTLHNMERKVIYHLICYEKH